MPQKLKLEILDGAQIGETVNVPGDKCSVGGKGSGSVLELSGLPYGIKLIDLVDAGRHWNVIEFEPGTVRLNGRQLKRRNKLGQGDEIVMPSNAAGVPFRVRVELETVKRQRTSLPIFENLNGTVVAAGAVYLMLFVAGGIYLTLTSSASDEVQILTVDDVSQALDADIARIGEDTVVPPAEFVLLSDEATRYFDLALFFAQDITLNERAELADDFRRYILLKFADAWRFEQQGRFSDAIAEYRAIVTAMGHRDLATTELALTKISQLETR